MSDEARRLTTEEERERFHLARKRGDMCAACGRTLSVDEAVYVERLLIGGSPMFGPVGVECASAELLEDANEREPARCAGCGRGIYYRAPNSRRRRATCSRRCVSAAAARRRKAGG